MQIPSDQLIYSSRLVSLRCLVVSEMQNNVYLFTNKISGQQLLVDAADDFEAISTWVQAVAQADGPLPQTRVTDLVTTHSHWDHIRALPQAVSTWSPRTWAGATDAPAITQQEGVQVEQLLTGGERLTLAGLPFEVIALRGHTPGSIALVYREEGQAPLIVTGDSLFPGGVGKTQSPQDFAQLLGDVEARLFQVFEDATLILPGHGPSTTLGAERPQLEDWRQRGW